jgi:hypothetical protein
MHVAFGRGFIREMFPWHFIVRIFMNNLKSVGMVKEKLELIRKRLAS